MICLDANVAINVINRRNPTIRLRFGEQLRSGVAIIFPVIALFEMRFGVAKSKRPAETERVLDEFLASGIVIAPFESEDASHAADIRAHLERLGTPIGAFDILVAAQARSRNATLITANRREFDRVPGLLVADWSL